MNWEVLIELVKHLSFKQQSVIKWYKTEFDEVPEGNKYRLAEEEMWYNVHPPRRAESVLKVALSPSVNTIFINFTIILWDSYYSI